MTHGSASHLLFGLDGQYPACIIGVFGLHCIDVGKMVFGTATEAN